MWILFSLLASADAACRCAPLASCVVHANGTRGCVCPFYGDGVESCEEQRFVTDATVRSRADIGPWVSMWEGARVGHMVQRRLLGETQYVLELDSTNYDAMVELTRDINKRGWPLEVALLGSATSRVVTRFDREEERPPLLEVLNVSFNSSWWELELAVGGGMLFLSSEVVPLPCIHVASECCSVDYMFYPFRTGVEDWATLSNCTLPVSNVSQKFGTLSLQMRSHFALNEDSSVSLRLHEQELPSFAATDADHANFSVGVVQGGASPVATQVQVSLYKGRLFSNYTVGTFTRQVAPYVMMQVESVGGNQTMLRLLAQITLPNATVQFVQYAWGDMDWIYPLCQATEACFEVPTPCRGSVKDGMLEMWVPVANHSTQKGNLSLYFVLQQGATLARVMTQCGPEVVVQHCADALLLREEVEVQILQGLLMKQIYRGGARAFMQLDVEPQTDTLVTLVARSARGVRLESLQAVHTRSEEERRQVMENATCATCVAEQLIFDGKVVSPRSCYLFGAGEESRWIESYVGLVGSRLAMDVLGRVPADVRSGAAAGAWINPVWPWENATSEVTYLHATFGPAPSPNARRLLSVNRSPQLQCKWFVVASAALVLFVWHLYQITVFVK